MKGKKLQPRILYPARHLIKFNGEIKAFQMNKSKENSAPLNQFYNKGTSLGRKHKRRKRATKINPKQNSDRITHIFNYFKCKWIKCTNQKTGGVGTKTRAIYMLSTRDLVISNTVFQQHKRRLYTCTSSDGQH